MHVWIYELKYMYEMGKYFTNGLGYKGRILINKTIVCLYTIGYQKSKEFPIKKKTKS